MTTEGEGEPPSAPSPAAGVNMLIQESWRMTFHFQNAETPLAVDAPHGPLLGVLGYSLSRLTPWKFPRSVTAGKYSSAIKKRKVLRSFPFLRRGSSGSRRRELLGSLRCDVCRVLSERGEGSLC